MRTNDPVFASRPQGAMVDIVGFGGKGLIFTPYGEHWRQMRKVCVVELLSARQVRRMERIRQAEVSRLVESVAAAAASASSSADAVVNLSQGLTALANNVIARAVFGGECRQQEAYLRELEVVATLAGGFGLADLFPSSRLARWLSGAARDLRRSHAQAESITAGIIQERVAKRSTATTVAGDDVQDEDLLDVLLRLQEEGSLTLPLTTEIIGAVISVSAIKDCISL